MNRIEFPVSSGIMAVLGSGRAAFQASYDRWQHSDAAGTSRTVFSALGDAMRAGVDPNTGGPPQLVGLYRIGSGRTFGIIWEGKRYFYGTEVKHAARFETVNWHNELFEIGDPGSLGRRIDSQPQPRPNSLK